MEKLGSGYLCQLEFFHSFVKFSFLSVGAHGEADLSHVPCSCEPKRACLFFKDRATCWYSLPRCAEL